MSDWKPDIVLYHFPCDDGFAAAWIARERWPGVELRPVNYGEPLPPEVVTGKHVLIADFSYPAAQLQVMAVVAKSIVILDHHKTAEAELAGLPTLQLPRLGYAGDFFAANPMNVLAFFDKNHCGAALTWRFCFGGEPMPRLIAWIEDRDLWHFRMEQSRKVSLFLRSHPYDLDIWTSIISDCDDDAHGGYEATLAEATTIERYYDRQIEDIARTATERDFAGFHHVPVAYAPYAMVSDVAHRLLENSLHAPFAAIGVHAYDGLTWSLRSQDHREDVSAIAKKYGGGGHRNAAGFRSVL